MWVPSVLVEWSCICVGADEQAWRARPVAPCVVDATDDHRVAWLHEHLIGVGDEVDLAAHARQAVQRVGMMHWKSGSRLDFQCAANQSVGEGLEAFTQTRCLRPVAGDRVVDRGFLGRPQRGAPEKPLAGFTLVSPRCRTAERPCESGPTTNRLAGVVMAVLPFRLALTWTVKQSSLRALRNQRFIP